MRHRAGFAVVLASALVFPGAVRAANVAEPETAPQAVEAVAKAVLFYLSTCPHCHKVLTEVLPPLTERYGNRLKVVGVEVSSPQGQALYLAAADFFRLPDDQRGVPLLVVGPDMLYGADEIEERFPGMIETILAEGGNDWPPIEPLRDALASQGLLQSAAAPDDPSAPSATPSAPPAGLDGSLTEAAAPPSLVERLARDPLANGIAVLVLLGLVAGVAVSLAEVRGGAGRLPAVPSWFVPVLCVLGIGVAAYMSFVAVSGQEAVCGPVGDCNAVQGSAYAKLLGVVPVGLLGLGGYVAMLATWGAARFGGASTRPQALRVLWSMALAGAVFSAYLTFLEPFVIGATCMWCIASALIMGGLLVSTTAELRRAA